MIGNTEKSLYSQLYKRLSYLRWLILSLGLFLVLLHQFLEGYLHYNPLLNWELVEVVYGVLISIAAWIIITWLRRSVVQRDRAKYVLNQTLIELSQSNRRLEFLLQVNHRLSEAEDRQTLSDIILDLFMDVAPAAACSLVCFDSQQRTLPAAYRSKGSTTNYDNQAPHLSSDQARQHCQACAQAQLKNEHTCAIFAPPLPETTIEKTLCLELARGDQVYGVLSLYLEDAAYPNDQEQVLLDMMASEISLAMESQSLHTREMIVLNRLQNSRQLSDMHDEVAGVLVTTVNALQATGGVLFFTDGTSSELLLQAEAGRSLGDSLDLVKGLASGTGQAEMPLIISDLEQDTGDEIRSLLIAPLRVGDRSLGSLILWADRPDAFTRRRAQLVATVAGQAALLIENYRLYMRGEHQAILAERARLAREIHDGLAQTLGYLKLRTAQIDNWLEHGDDQQARIALSELQQLLGNAYANTREAIDGLRLAADAQDLQAWVQEIVSEFETSSGIPVTLSTPPDISLPLEVHVQLHRVVHEAFSNIRKHADATRAWLEWHQDDYWLTLQIKDNGCGFDLDDIPLTAQHGLRIMRERAELIDADFQVTSQEDEGTQVFIRLPLKEYVSEAPHE